MQRTLREGVVESYALLAMADEKMAHALAREADMVDVLVEKATTGETALKCATEKPPAVIILELAAQTMKAYPLLKRLRDGKHPAHRARIVGFVGHNDFDNRNRGSQAGCDYVYTRTELTKQIRSILRTLMPHGT